jgi:rhamnulose-1-phosphate aldolase
MGKKKINTGFKRYFKEISEIAGYLWERGWAERNAGNFSINITEECKFEIKSLFKFPVNSLDKSYSSLKNNFLLISSAGSRMKDVMKEPYKYTLVLYITESGKDYICFGINKERKKLKQEILPTSELSTHLAYQNLFKEYGSKCKAILHSHPTEIIALTHLEKFTNEQNLNELLFNMHPEVKLFIPEGVGFVPFMNSGNEEIANATLKSAQDHRVVVWEKHGCCSSGETLTDAFELTDIISKSAKIYFLCK